MGIDLKVGRSQPHGVKGGLHQRHILYKVRSLEPRSRHVCPPRAGHWAARVACITSLCPPNICSLLSFHFTKDKTEPCVLGNLTQSHTPNYPVELGFDDQRLAPQPMHLTSKLSKPTFYKDFLHPGPTGCSSVQT